MTLASLRPLVRRTLKILFVLFIAGSSIAGIQSMAEGSSLPKALDYLAACKDSGTPADVRYTIDALQEFVGSTDCERSLELLNRRSIITLKNKQLRTVQPIGSLTYTQKLELIEGDHKRPPCSPSSAKPPADLASLGGMSALLELRIENYNLTSAEFLRAMPQLLKVDLTCNNLTDIAPAAAIPGLRQLVLPSNELTKLADLSPLKSLEWLNVSHNNIAAVAPLTAMAALNRVNLSHNKLTAMPSTDFLSYLDVSHNQIAGGSHPGASSLVVSHNRLKGLSFISRPEGIFELMVNDNALSSLAGIGAFTKLYGLNLSRNPLGAVEVSAIPAADLQHLALTGLGLKELPDFSRFANLRELHFADNELTEFDQARLPRLLHSLFISRNKLKKLVLTELPITTLAVRDNLLEHITFSCPGTEIETGIAIDGNRFIVTPQIVDCPMLSGFSARNAKLRNLVFMGQIKELWRVDLRDNPIADVSPLKDLERIAVIRLEGTPLAKPGAKNASNCPTDARSKALADFCRQKSSP